ncbi:response regulator [bacterium]|nr:response regulator [bacterium]
MIAISEHIDIVMVEDDPGHAKLIEKNLRRAGISNRMVHFENGRQALDYFQSDGFDREGQTLVLLDLNLPEVDGYEVLRTLKSDKRTQAIPVIVLTTTDNPREIDRCYAMGCNVYITKPVEYEQFSEAIRKFGLMLSIVKLPGEQ